jgi:hypothetical protein
MPSRRSGTVLGRRRLRAVSDLTVPACGPVGRGPAQAYASHSQCPLSHEGPAGRTTIDVLGQRAEAVRRGTRAGQRAGLWAGVGRLSAGGLVRSCVQQLGAAVGRWPGLLSMLRGATVSRWPSALLWLPEILPGGPVGCPMPRCLRCSPSVAGPHDDRQLSCDQVGCASAACSAHGPCGRNRGRPGGPGARRPRPALAGSARTGTASRQVGQSCAAPAAPRRQPFGPGRWEHGINSAPGRLYLVPPPGQLLRDHTQRLQGPAALRKRGLSGPCGSEWARV